MASARDKRTPYPIPHPINPHEVWFNEVLQSGPKIVHSTARNGLLRLCRTAVLYRLPLGYKILSRDARDVRLLVYVPGQESMADSLLHSEGYEGLQTGKRRHRNEGRFTIVSSSH